MPKPSRASLGCDQYDFGVIDARSRFLSQASDRRACKVPCMYADAMGETHMKEVEFILLPKQCLQRQSSSAPVGDAGIVGMQLLSCPRSVGTILRVASW